MQSFILNVGGGPCFALLKGSQFLNKILLAKLCETLC